MAEEPLPLAGRCALVIGAGTPAGSIIAAGLAAAGADVAVASATTEGEEVMAVRRTRRTVVAFGRRSAEYAFDTTLGQNVLVSTRQVSKEMGGLDLLVNAQDAPSPAAAERITDSDWSRTLALNLSGVFFACRAAVREMTAGGEGRRRRPHAGAGRRVCPTRRRRERDRVACGHRVRRSSRAGAAGGVYRPGTWRPQRAALSRSVRPARLSAPARIWSSLRHPGSGSRP